MKILKLFIRNTKNKTINYKTDNNLSHLDTSKSNQIIGEIKKINEKYIKNEPPIQYKLKNKLNKKNDYKKHNHLKGCLDKYKVAKIIGEINTYNSEIFFFFLKRRIKEISKKNLIVSKKMLDNDIESELIQHKLKNELENFKNNLFEHQIESEIETFNIIDTIKLNIKTEFYLSDNENISNSVFIEFRQSRQEYNLFELKNKLPNNELSVQNIFEYFNEKIIGICFKLNKKMFDNKKIKICLNNSNISIFDGSKSSQTNIDFEIIVENNSKVYLYRLKSNLLKVNINNSSQLKFMEIISNNCKIYSNNSNITTTIFGKSISIFKNFHCELNNGSKLELNEEISVKNIFKITSDKSITFIKLMHPIVNHFEYIGLNHSTAKLYILQNFKNVLNMFLGIELNQSHINMDIIENKKNGLQFKNVKFIKDLYSTHNINNNV